ncbi:MAG: hypothetical protein D084_Lepto4C00097G0003 [Leptospirillum sp. Group IV 'UBA BS']|nr:MAG: hypothetical protein D084_Lepto4C00097G0003 [Leptospirillum sp. Group IV 'UBA BS']
MKISGTGSITPATLTATASTASMASGSAIPTLSGTVTGFVNGQTLSGDGGTADWTTTATSSSNEGSYGITGKVTLGFPWSGDYTVVQSSANTTALTIGGITSDNLNPVAQTVDLYQKLPSLPGTSSNNAFSSPSSSGNSMTLDESQNSSLSVIQPAGDDTTGGGILSVEELKN